MKNMYSGGKCVGMMRQHRKYQCGIVVEQCHFNNNVNKDFLFDSRKGLDFLANFFSSSDFFLCFRWKTQFDDRYNECALSKLKKNMLIARLDFREWKAKWNYTLACLYCIRTPFFTLKYTARMNELCITIVMSIFYLRSISFLNF